MDRKTSEILHRYREEVATPDEREQAQVVLSRSREARAFLADDERLRRIVRENGAGEFQPFFVDRFMRRLEARRKAPAGRFDWTWLSMPAGRLAWAGVAAVIVIALAVLFIRPTVQHVSVPYGETASVTLPDGSVAMLAAGSTLTYPRRFADERSVRLNGEAYLDVVPGAHPFRVETADAFVMVRGTKFNVRAWQDVEGETRVTLESGVVEVVLRNDTTRVIRLRPGQTTTASGDTLLSRPREISLDRVLAWRQGGIAFVDMPLRYVLAELQRRFDVEISVADDRASRRHLTYLEPAPRSVQTVLDDICQVLNLEYRRTARGYVLSTP